MRRDDGGGNGGWWLAHHSHARPSCGEIAAAAWLRGRNYCRADNSSCELLRYSTLNVQDGCGRREERENGGKNSQAEACVHMCIPIAAASKVGLKELASDAILR